MADPEEPSYIDYETFLSPTFSAVSFANSLVLSTNNPSDHPLDLSTPLSRVLFDVQEIDTHIDSLTTKSALPLLQHLSTTTSASNKILDEVQTQADALNEAYGTLRKDVLERYTTAEEVRVVAERLCQTVRLARAVGRCLLLGRQLEVQVGEIGGSNNSTGASSTSASKKPDHRAMVRSATTLSSLRLLLNPSLDRITCITRLKTDLLLPTERALLTLSQHAVREFSPSPGSALAEAQARTVSAFLTLYILSPVESTAPAPFTPTLLIATLTSYLQNQLKTSLASLVRSLATLPTLDRTLGEIAARCQAVLALEALLRDTRPPEHPALVELRQAADAGDGEGGGEGGGGGGGDFATGPKDDGSEEDHGDEDEEDATLLQPLLTALDTPSLVTFFWRSLAGALPARVADIMQRGGVSARTLRANRERVREAVKACVERGGTMPGARGGASGKWEREAAVMVGAVVGGIGR